jgi:hypothetical protein
VHEGVFKVQNGVFRDTWVLARGRGLVAGSRQKPIVCSTEQRSRNQTRDPMGRLTIGLQVSNLPHDFVASCDDFQG